jgi:hypothetical protein
MAAVRRFIAETRGIVAELPAPLRFAVLVAAGLGTAGALIGLVLGLVAYPPTAWAAALEVGIPAALLGGLIGLVAGGVVHVLHPGRAGSGRH